MHLEVIVGGALLAWAWARAWRARGSPPATARAALFAGGLLALAGALVGPIHDLSERPLIAAHMAQHLLLMLVVPPCLLAGTPDWMLDDVLAPLLRRPLLRRLLAMATRPLPALGLYAAALALWHLPGPYARTLASHGWHLAAHATLMGAALLAWWPVVSPSRQLPALPYGAQILYLFAFGVPMTVVAAMITGAEQVLYPTASPVPLDDQRLGGVLMWVPAGLVPLVAFTTVFFRWVAAEPEEVADYPK